VINGDGLGVAVNVAEASEDGSGTADATDPVDGSGGADGLHPPTRSTTEMSAETPRLVSIP
jgi:hypothetical protein